MCVLPFPHNKQKDPGEKGSFFFVPLSSECPAWGLNEGGNEWVYTPSIRLSYFYMSNPVRVTSLSPLSSWWCKGSKFKVTWLVKGRGIILTQLCGSYTDRILKDLLFVWCICVYICVPEYVCHRINVASNVLVLMCGKQFCLLSHLASLTDTLFYPRQGFTVQPWLSWSSLYRWGYSGTHVDLPASASWALALKVYNTTPDQGFTFSL